jgi:hypothetical protein
MAVAAEWRMMELTCQLAFTSIMIVAMIGSVCPAHTVFYPYSRPLNIESIDFQLLFVVGCEFSFEIIFALCVYCLILMPTYELNCDGNKFLCDVEISFWFVSLQETYEKKKQEHVAEMQKKEEEMRQMFVVRVKEKEAELKEAEKEVKLISF